VTRSKQNREELEKYKLEKMLGQVGSMFERIVSLPLAAWNIL
jgi:hypothetical protein